MKVKYNAIIILVNYNSAADTLACISSIEKSETAFSFRIVVVDNCSTDGSISSLSDSNGTYDFVQAEANNGYCAGNNVGIHYAEKHYQFDYIWILNPDTEVLPDTLENMLSFAYKNQDVGLLGSLLLYNFDRDTIQAYGGNDIGFSKKLNFQILPHFFGRKKLSEVKDSLPDVIRCKTLVGASLLIKKAVFEQAGYLEESYFLYSDESEFCIRVARKTAFKICATKNAIVYHKEGSRKSDRKYITYYYLLRNWLFNTKVYYTYLTPYVYMYNLAFCLKMKIQKQRELAYYVGWALKDFRKNVRGKFPHPTFGSV